MLDVSPPTMPKKLANETLNLAVEPAGQNEIWPDLQ
jgi:hypothetical protein